jgi:hypothetical protein
MIGTDPFPYWDGDPTRAYVPITSLTAAGSMLTDVIILIACGVALCAEALARCSIRWWAVLLWSVGAAGVALHSFYLQGNQLDNARLGISWVAALAAGLTAVHVCRTMQVRRLTFAVTISLVSVLAAKGALQVFLEHRQTVEEFQRNREAFLAAQGWSPDSAAARAFERRLDQAEATGWFGMANVYASFAAASLVALVGWVALAIRKTKEGKLPSGWTGVLVLGALAAAGAVAMAGSKGGVGASLIGLALLALFGAARPYAPSSLKQFLSARAGCLAISLVVFALVAVAARGVLGERLGERSLLFRWFYQVGAVRIVAAHPLYGSGPAGFKDAYMLAKSPTSPEDVIDPHSILFDYVGTLGAFGVAWCILWLTWVYGIGERVAGSLRSAAPMPATEPHARARNWLAVAIILVPSLCATWIEWELRSPDAAAARAVGIVGALGIAIGALNLMRTTLRWRWVAAAAALALATHAQIELTPTWPGASALFMVLIAGAAAPPTPSASRLRAPNLLAGVLIGASGAAAIALAVAPAVRWESDLGLAADAVRPAAEIHARASELLAPGGGATPQSIAELAADLGALIHAPPPQTPGAFEAAMNRLLIQSSAAAAEHLQSAVARYPTHFPTTEALVRLLLARASAEASLNELSAAKATITAASILAADFAASHPSSGAWGLAGNAELAAFQLLGRTDRLQPAAQAFEKSAALDPYGPNSALRAMDAYAALADHDDARFWARETQRRNELQHLDPLRQLTETERRRVDAALSGP